MSDYVEHGETHELEGHPTPRQYVGVAVVLAVITALEVAIYYVSSLRSLLVPLLFFFSLIKFLLVALWFMHLRFDNRIFRRFFVLGVLLAFAVFAVVLVFFFTHGGAAPAAS